MTTLLGQAVAFVYCLVLPGLLFALRRDREGPAVPRMLAEAFTFALLVVPMACFCAAWLLGTSIRPALVFGVATLFNAAGGARVLWVRRRRGGGGP